MISKSSFRRWSHLKRTKSTSDSVQQVCPTCMHISPSFVLLLLLGRRVAIVRSVDGSPINCFTIHECEGPARLSSRPRRYIFTGHDNGSIQLFDLTTAIELSTTTDNAPQSSNGGPSPADLLKMLDRCDFAATNGQHQHFLSSRCPTPCCVNNSLSNAPNSTVNLTTTLITAPSSAPGITVTTKEESEKNN